MSNNKKPKTAMDEIFSSGGIITILFFAFWGALILWINANRELEQAERYITYLHENIPEKLGRKLNAEYNQEQEDIYEDR